MAQKLLIKWLNDAYGMEKSLIQVMENHAKDAKDYPEIKTRIEQHIEETKGQCERLEQCLEHLGEKASAIKGASGTFMGALQGASTGLAKDEAVKNGAMDFAAEYFEIASYKAIQHLATKLGHDEVAKLCAETIPEEEAMAKFLEEHLPQTVDAYLAREEQEEASSRPERSTMEPAFGEEVNPAREQSGED